MAEHELYDQVLACPVMHNMLESMPMCWIQGLYVAAGRAGLYMPGLCLALAEVSSVMHSAYKDCNQVCCFI